MTRTSAHGGPAGKLEPAGIISLSSFRAIDGLIRIAAPSGDVRRDEGDSPIFVDTKIGTAPYRRFRLRLRAFSCCFRFALAFFSAVR
jgi:hypothetical protein